MQQKKPFSNGFGVQTKGIIPYIIHNSSIVVNQMVKIGKKSRTILMQTNADYDNDYAHSRKHNVQSAHTSFDSFYECNVYHKNMHTTH